MLAQLAVKDIVLIDRLGLDFETGMTVLTGETGAGKSILLDALALALGARGDAGLVRAGARQGEVTAVFEPSAGHAVYEALKEFDIAAGEPIILRRVQMTDGRTRAYLNDQPIGVAAMGALGNALVEIHGQHDARALIEPREHRRLLDAFGMLAPDGEGVARRYRDLKDIEARVATLRRELEAARREADFLRAAVEELSALSPEPDEEDRLAARRAALMGAEKVAGDLNEAYEAIGGSVSPVPDLASLLRRLERKAGQAPELLQPAVRALGAALDNLEEARLALQDGLRQADFDPQELERVEERLFALRAAARKYQVGVADLPGEAASFAGKLAALETGEGELALLLRRAKEARSLYDAAAAHLSERRHAAASALEAAVNAELPALRLEAARFMVAIASDAGLVSPEGYDRVGFEVQTNPGTLPGPLMKVASGGELSRFLLALKVALADRGSAPTLVFDEVDTGAGGAVAEAIGRRLARLAERVQVLSVTHAPQVAARADRHFVITKRGVPGEERVATLVEPVEGARRREEIARMLSGARISDEARAAADRLLADAV